MGSREGRASLSACTPRLAPPHRVPSASAQLQHTSCIPQQGLAGREQGGSGLCKAKLRGWTCSTQAAIRSTPKPVEATNPSAAGPEQPPPPPEAAPSQGCSLQAALGCFKQHQSTQSSPTEASCWLNLRGEVLNLPEERRKEEWNGRGQRRAGGSKNPRMLQGSRGFR